MRRLQYLVYIFLSAYGADSRRKVVYDHACAVECACDRGIKRRVESIMNNVIMMCGVCGSGKTTYAKQKEKNGYVRLSIDEELWQTYGRKGIDYPDSRYEELSEKVEAVLCERLIRFMKDGKNVVIDFSFWSKETLQKRLKKRNTLLNADSPFIITNEILEHHYNNFEEPQGEGEIILLQD